MRKIIFMVCIIILLLDIPVYALTIDGIYDSKGVLCTINAIEEKVEGYNYNECYSFEVNGEEYFFCANTTTSPIKYEEETWNFFVVKKGARDYLWTGEHYYARHTYTDWSAQSYKGGNHHIYLYDSNFNLVKEKVFNQYPKEIAYTDGIYYVRLAANNNYGENIPECIMQSTDFENWTTCENIIYKKSNIYFKGREMSFDNKLYYLVKYENQFNEKIYENEFPLWYIKSNNQISSDGIYSIYINTSSKSPIVGSYFYDTFYVIQYADGSKMILDKNEVMSSLEELQKAPYIVYNNQILAFEQPPVIQNDRTLIPIRFLFEQMGATVDWNHDTQTATISQNNTAVSFAINDNEAVVNGETATMDVPAQLINGKTMVPVRFLSEELGYTVNWDDETRIITIE